MASRRGENIERVGRGSARRRRGVSPAWAAAVIFAVTVAAYLPSLRAGFVWDDDTHLTGNIVLQEDGLRRVWTTTDSPNYWPVTWTSFWIEHQLWGLRPLGYHAVNVLLHALNSLLVWRVMSRLNVPGALLVGLLFAVHPVNVASVAWITQRKNLLCMLFFAAALLAYLRFEDRGRRRMYLAAVALFSISLLSKGAGVGFPLVLLLCAWWRRGRIAWNDDLRSVPFFVVAAVASGVEIWFQQHLMIAGTAIRQDGLAARLAGAGWAVWFYLSKAVLPLDLAFVYPSWKVDPNDPLSYAPTAALLALAAACWRARRGWGRPLLIGLGSYLVLLAPVLGLIDVYFMRYAPVADHYQYLALPVVLALLVAAGHRLWMRVPSVSLRTLASTAALLLAVLAALTWRQASLYRDTETLLLDTIAKNPSCWMAYCNLGVLEDDRDRAPKALEYLRESLRLNPDNPEARLSYGLVLARLGRLDEAVDQYRAALRLQPRFPLAHSNLGLALQERGDRSAAEKHFRLAIEQAPHMIAAHNNLGNLLVQSDRIPEAIAVFQAVLEFAPEHAGTHNNLAVAYLVSQRYGEAGRHLTAALNVDPKNRDVLRNQQRLNALMRATETAPPP